MATKYHVSKAGTAARCSAEKRGCPLGGDVPHAEFDSKEAAGKWAEAEVAKQFGSSFSQEEVKSADVERAEQIAAWEEGNNNFYVEGTIMENAPSQWDVDYLKETLAVVEDSQLARETVDIFADKLRSLNSDEWDELDAEEEGYRQELQTLMDAYDKTPRRAAQLEARRQARAKRLAAEAQRVAEAEAAEAARRASLTEGQRWEEDWEYEQDEPRYIAAGRILPGAEKNIAAAMKVADESEKAREVLEAYQESVYSNNFYDDEDHDEATLAQAKELLSAYDKTPRRAIEIASYQLAVAQENALKAQLRSSDSEAIRNSVAELKKKEVYFDRSALVENNATPADVIRAEVLPRASDETFVKIYDHPSKPFADVSVAEATAGNPGAEVFKRYDEFASKIDSGQFYKSDLENLRRETTSTESSPALISEPLKVSLFARLRKRLGR